MLKTILEEKIIKNCSDFGLKQSISIILAVSGGCDSIALMFLLKKYFNIYVITFDHGARKESCLDANFVYNLCAENKIPCKIINIKNELLNKVINKELTNSNNFQNKARLLRYKYLIAECKNNNINYIATGHHLDDITENFILKILRKGGALAVSTNKILQINEIKIIRPLFNISKEEILSFLQENNISWAQDPTNFTDKYKRNQVRIGLDAFFNYSKINKLEFQKNLLFMLNNISENNKIIQNLIDFHKKQISFHSLGFAFFKDFHLVSRHILFFLVKFIIQKFNIKSEIKASKINYFLDLIEASIVLKNTEIKSQEAQKDLNKDQKIAKIMSKNDQKTSKNDENMSKNDENMSKNDQKILKNNNLKHTFFGICAQVFNNNIIFYLLPNFKKIQYININNIFDQINLLNANVWKFNWLDIFKITINKCNSNNNQILYNLNSTYLDNDQAQYGLNSIYIEDKKNNQVDMQANMLDISSILKKSYIIDFLTNKELNYLLLDQKFYKLVGKIQDDIKQITNIKSKDLCKSIICALPVIKLLNLNTNEKIIISVPSLNYFNISNDKIISSNLSRIKNFNINIELF